MVQASDLLRDTRRLAGLSQTELAQAAQTSQAAVARYESGRVAPSVPTLERLIAALGMRLELRAVARFSGPRGQLLEARRAEILAACRRYGARSPRIFGSVARGDDGPDSDIDLLVDLDDGRTLLDLERLQVELSELLAVPVDVGTEDMLHGGVSESIRADVILL